MSGLYVMVRRHLRVNRTVLIAMAAVTAVNNVVQITAYQSLFPNPAARATTLASFTSNGALRALYGYPFDITSPTGWLSWRALGFIAVVMAMWGAFTTVGALRGEEEAGRADLALSQPQSRRVWFSAALLAVTVETLMIGAVNVAALVAFCVTKGLMTFVDTLEISLQLMLPALLFAGAGAVASQLIGTTRGARIVAAAVLAVACSRALSPTPAAGSPGCAGRRRWAGSRSCIHQQRHHRLRSSPSASPSCCSSLLRCSCSPAATSGWGCSRIVTAAGRGAFCSALPGRRRCAMICPC